MRLSTFLEVLLGSQSADRDRAALEAALVRLVRDETPRTRAAFFELLQNARLIVPSFDAAQSHEGDSGLPLITVEDDEGQRALVAFTSTAELVAFAPDRELFMEVDVATLVEIAVIQDFMALLLNIGGEHGYEVSREELLTLRSGALPVDFGERSSTQLAAADALEFTEPQPAEVESLRTLLGPLIASFDEVLAVHALRSHAPAPEAASPPESSLTLAFSFRHGADAARRHEICDACGLLAARELPELQPLALLTLDSPALQERVLQHAFCVFQRA